MTWIAFDTETTGLEPGSRLLEIAAIAFADDGTVIGTFANLIDPGMPIPPDATVANGITDAMVAGQPSTAEVLACFLAWLPADGTLIAHHASFDEGVVSWECQRAGLPLPSHPIIDTRTMARHLRDSEDNRLQTLVRHHGLAPIGDAHRALPDADAVRQYFLSARTRTAPSPRPWRARHGHVACLPSHLAAVPDLIATGQPLRFRYRNQAGRSSTSTIIPYGWAGMADGRILLHGYCAWAQARRNFDVSRMSPCIMSID